jgi:hypothetical protein
LKATEKRADKWRAAFGVEQTEIDALASLRPELLQRLTREATEHFYDVTLTDRVDEAEHEWLEGALDVINANLDTERLGRIRAEAADKLDAMREQIEALNQELRIDVDDFDLPDLVIPGAHINGTNPWVPLIDSDDPFAEQTRRLIDSKAYRGGAQ